MPLRYAPNLSMLYTEVPFLERFGCAGADGFRAVEFLFPYREGVDCIRRCAEQHKLEIVLFDIPPGDEAAGDLGTLADPLRRSHFRQSFHTALEAAIHLHCRRLNILFGNRVRGLARQAQVECALENLAWAAPQANQAGVTLLLEPLNPLDRSAYLLHTTAEAMAIIEQVNHPAVMLQYDVYHAQISEGNLINNISRWISHIGHIQIAEVPGRHEPGTGEIDYRTVLKALEELGYQGYIGLEYRPLRTTQTSLCWLPREFRG